MTTRAKHIVKSAEERLKAGHFGHLTPAKRTTISIHLLRLYAACQTVEEMDAFGISDLALHSLEMTDFSFLMKLSDEEEAAVCTASMLQLYIRASLAGWLRQDDEKSSEDSHMCASDDSRMCAPKDSHMCCDTCTDANCEAIKEANLAYRLMLAEGGHIGALMLSGPPVR